MAEESCTIQVNTTFTTYIIVNCHWLYHRNYNFIIIYYTSLSVCLTDCLLNRSALYPIALVVVAVDAIVINIIISNLMKDLWGYLLKR